MDENWIVEFYETENGEKPSLDFINTLEVKLRAKVFRFQEAQNDIKRSIKRTDER